jgi:ABC-type multidrug transport system fused ATPase/permease subunit
LVFILLQQDVKNAPTWFQQLVLFINSFEQFDAITLMILVISLGIVLSNIMLILLTWGRLKSLHSIESKMVTSLFSSYIHKDYADIIQIPYSDIAKDVLTESQNFVHKFLTAYFEIITQGFLALFVLLALFIIDPLMSVFALLIIGVFYGGLAQIFKRRMKFYGRQREIVNSERHKLVNLILNNIKLTKIHGLELFFESKIKQTTDKMNIAHVQQGMAHASPMYLMDMILILILLFISVFTNSMNLSLTLYLPTLSLFVLAMLKTKPSINKIYMAINHIQFYQSMAFNYIESISRFTKTSVDASEDKNITASTKFRNLTLSNVTYKYNQENRSEGIFDVNLNLNHSSVIGITGPTGAGKTTLVNVLLGLLEPQTGTIHLNEVELTKDQIRSYQTMIAYVPQDVILYDGTIASNVAFGINKEDIDILQVNDCIHLAQLDEFVSTLQEGIHTEIGEQGLMLSGGQRQRIAIARALYRNPQIIILDESTNALDYETELNLLESITKTKSDRLIIFISHRLETLSLCDLIVIISKGHIVHQGTYQKLKKHVVSYIDHK